MRYNRLRKADVLEGCDGDAADAALGDQLKTYFDAVVAGPVPDSLLKLTDALDKAFERGEIKCCDRLARIRAG